MKECIFCFSYQIALHVAVNGYGLVFGWNTFLALCLQSLLTLIVVDKRGLHLDDRPQVIFSFKKSGSIIIIYLGGMIFAWIQILEQDPLSSTRYA